jgi:hypothetical protein
MRGRHERRTQRLEVRNEDGRVGFFVLTSAFCVQFSTLRRPLTLNPSPRNVIALRFAVPAGEREARHPPR